MVGERPRAGDSAGEWGAAARGVESRGQRGGKAGRRSHFLRAVVLPWRGGGVVLGFGWEGRQSGEEWWRGDAEQPMPVAPRHSCDPVSATSLSRHL